MGSQGLEDLSIRITSPIFKADISTGQSNNPQTRESNQGIKNWSDVWFLYALYFFKNNQKKGNI
jgi:hypothetical protein